MTPQATATIMKYLSADDIRDIGILQEVNRTFFHPLGLAAEVDIDTGTLRIQDWREDPEGMIFGEGVMERTKFERFEALKADREPARRVALGFVVQEPPR